MREVYVQLVMYMLKSTWSLFVALIDWNIYFKLYHVTLSYTCNNASRTILYISTLAICTNSIPSRLPKKSIT